MVLYLSVQSKGISTALCTAPTESAPKWLKNDTLGREFRDYFRHLVGNIRFYGGKGPKHFKVQKVIPLVGYRFEMSRKRKKQTHSGETIRIDM